MDKLATNIPKIMIVDDDFSVRNLVYRFLSRKYQIESASDGKSAMALFDQFNPALVILDWNLPDANGYKLCQEMQSRTNVLVLILTSRNDEADKIKILAAGADDFMTKPFSLAEVEVRVEALLRRIRYIHPHQSQRLVFQQLAINPEGREVKLNDKPLALTALEFNILHFLASHPGQAWSRPQLIQKIWGCDYVGDGRVVDVHIGQLRKKMEVDSSTPEFIKTVRGYGYKFEPPEGNKV
ncbi:MAG: response regulator transcription factor [Sphaerospermopsis kisseleviana]|jgi:two-component system alkaline phosphatase synthesis response regulator PhoP|uniref:Winged helix family two component transcriptional regulator n=3 Tax=Sphaerospermopsis TaxID=752201 RepID=A0A479ZVK4_9CYAN|nr:MULTISPECIES: response regulator transcription factor [Sphaerospermopsis]BAZ80152.1 winged helix family two component transcriptional regulator [Sphaerospermopsis kisseleviana NIES-73]MBC5796649.1 response regulator transcription factor [Sphaerospermopsis sp. LEGE 00249]MBD2131629.1 response regulator transcription factor [Sphaerospermopsis sp. FACHB-1094]MBD2146736.1 response regulator transcription factor [Sphaerospermopsis sp. FACHB-1194]MBE9238942.1 response regulator transcription fact